MITCDFGTFSCGIFVRDAIKKNKKINKPRFREENVLAIDNKEGVRRREDKADWITGRA